MVAGRRGVIGVASWLVARTGVGATWWQCGEKDENMNESVGYQRCPSNIFLESHELPVRWQLEGLLGLDAAVVVQPVPLLRHLQRRIFLAVPLVWGFDLQIQTYKCCTYTAKYGATTKIACL